MASRDKEPPEATITSNVGVEGPRTLNKNSLAIHRMEAEASVSDINIPTQNQPLMADKLQPLGIKREAQQDSSIRVLVENFEHRAKWFYPFTMLLLLVLGIGLAIGHHNFYKSLSGKIVGSTSSQQWSLRIGNGFAISVSYVLKIAVGMAYTQYLWMAMRNNSLAIPTIDDAFNIQDDPFSFLNWELVKKLWLGVGMAVVFWCIPLTSIFAPPTLSVTRSLISNSSTTNVYNMGISNSSLEHAFASTGGLDGTWGATSAVGRVIGAVAATGQRLNFLQPSNQGNISYELQAYVPLISCYTATQSAEDELISDLVDISGTVGLFPFNLKSDIDNSSFSWIDWTYINDSGDPANASVNALGNIGYFAMVPYRNVSAFHPNDTTSLLPWWNSSSVTEIPLYGLQGQFIAAFPQTNPDLSTTNWTLPGTNQSVIVSNFTKIQFITCQLYNASIKVQVNFTNGVSDSRILETTPIGNITAQNQNETSTASLIFFQELSTYLIGAVSWYLDIGFQIPVYYTETALLDTYMATGAEIYYMYKNIDYIFNKNTNGSISPDSLTPSQVRNITLAQDIENFVLNSSLSMLSDSTLCNMVEVNATSMTAESTYLYEPRNLALVYCFVVSTSALVIAMGAYALHDNGVFYHNKVSTFAIAMQNPEMIQALKEYSESENTLGKSVSGLRLRFMGPRGFLRVNQGNSNPLD